MVTDVDGHLDAGLGTAYTYGIGEMILFTVTFDQNADGRAARWRVSTFVTLPLVGHPVLLGGHAPAGSCASAAYVSKARASTDDWCSATRSWPVRAWTTTASGSATFDTLKLDAADTIEGTMGGLTAVLTHAEEGPQTGHKVDGRRRATSPRRARRPSRARRRWARR